MAIFIALLTMIAIGLTLFFVFSNNSSNNSEEQFHDNGVHYDELSPSNRIHGETILHEDLPANKFTDDFIPMTPSGQSFEVRTTPDDKTVVPAGFNNPSPTLIAPKLRDTLKFEDITTKAPVTTKPTVEEVSTYSTKSDEIPDNLPSFSDVDDRKYDTIETEDIYENCEQYRLAGKTLSGVYNFKVDDMEFKALCLMETDYAWMVLQRRFKNQLDFNKTFDEYVHGFGSPSSDYWLGLEKLYAYSKHGQLQMRIELRGDLCKVSCSEFGSSGYWWGDWNFNVSITINVV